MQIKQLSNEQAIERLNLVITELLEIAKHRMTLNGTRSQILIALRQAVPKLVDINECKSQINTISIALRHQDDHVMSAWTLSFVFDHESERHRQLLEEGLQHGAAVKHYEDVETAVIAYRLYGAGSAELAAFAADFYKPRRAQPRCL